MQRLAGHAERAAVGVREAALAEPRVDRAVRAVELVARDLEAEPAQGRADLVRAAGERLALHEDEAGGRGGDAEVRPRQRTEPRPRRRGGVRTPPRGLVRDALEDAVSVHERVAGGEDAAEDVRPSVRACGLGPGAADDAEVGLADAARHRRAAERAGRGGVLRDERGAGRLAVEAADEVGRGESRLADEQRPERVLAVASARVAREVAALGDDGEPFVLQQDPERRIHLRLRGGKRGGRRRERRGRRHSGG